MKAIHDIVAGVLGIQTDRGDLVVIESLPFEQTLAQEETANADAAASAKPGKTAPQTPLAKLLADGRVQIGAGGGVVLLAALIFLLKRRRTKAGVELDRTAAIAAAKPGEAGKDIVAGTAPQIAPAEEAPRVLPIANGRLALPEMDGVTKTLLNQIQDHVAKDPVFAAGVIRGWMEED
jgi:flagellar biosynthesis/type III secretory pathway M-ring protein FliF/YscJ